MRRHIPQASRHKTTTIVDVDRLLAAANLRRIRAAAVAAALGYVVDSGEFSAYAAVAT